MRVFIEDSFDSAHWLPHVLDDHKCRRLHGHTYRIRLEFSGKVDEYTGWIFDYSAGKWAWDQIKGKLDHACLNDQIPNPTCENLALFIMDEFKRRWKEKDTYNWNGCPAPCRIEIRETERCGVVLDCE